MFFHSMAMETAGMAGLDHVCFFFLGGYPLVFQHTYRTRNNRYHF